MNKLLVLFSLSILPIISGCDPHFDGKVMTVGDTRDYVEGIKISFDACDYWIDDHETTLSLELTFTIDTTSEYKVRWGDVYYYVVAGKKIYSIVENNEELNGYNIFDVIVTEETQYTFYFEVSLDEYFKDENGDIKHGNWGTHCHIEPANFDITLVI